MKEHIASFSATRPKLTLILIATILTMVLLTILLLGADRVRETNAIATARAQATQLMHSLQASLLPDTALRNTDIPARLEALQATPSQVTLVMADTLIGTTHGESFTSRAFQHFAMAPGTPYWERLKGAANSEIIRFAHPLQVANAPPAALIVTVPLPSLLAAENFLGIWPVIVFAGGAILILFLVALVFQYLAGRVQEEHRLIELTNVRNNQLRQATEAAEAANKSKSEFLASMSHELRTPLNAILGFSDMMRNRLFGPLGAPQYQDYIQDIHASGLHLLELINEILDLSRIEAGKYHIHLEIVKLSAVAEECLRLISPEASKRHVSLVSEFEPTLPDIFADKRLLKQMMLNLLSNAIKFTPSHGTVTLTLRSDEKNYLAIVVKDTGIGMREEDIGKALAPFGQLGSALTAGAAGTGLGLTLTDRFAKLHRGRLEIQSAPGKGTTAALILPVSLYLPRDGTDAAPDDEGRSGSELHTAAFVNSTNLNREQITSVQESFRILASNADHFATVFYDTLFRIAPDLKTLFRDDMEQQRKKFFDTLSYVVRGLDDLHEMEPVIRALGQKHLDYGVRDRDYAIVASALIEALEECLGNQFTAETRQAWMACYFRLSHIMLSDVSDTALQPFPN